MVQICDIVKFNSPVTEAGLFCKNKGITGKVVAYDCAMCIVEVGFDYQIYAFPHELEVITTKDEIPLESD